MSAETRYSILESVLFPSTNLNEKKLRQRLKGKTVLITGASYGIGEALAYKLAPTGAHLLLIARTTEQLEIVKKNIEDQGGAATIYPTDLTKPEQVQQLIVSLLNLPSGIDIVINNAGKSIRRPIKDSLDRLHDFTRTMGVNYLGPVQLLLSLIPILEKNKGQVINISAINVLLAPAPSWAAYQASKTAFDQWFRCASPELELSGIATTSIYLPLVRTRMIAPTPIYNNMPAMNAGHVAKIICNCIINRSKRHTPWWLIFPQVASAIFLRPWERLSSYYLKRNSNAHSA